MVWVQIVLALLNRYIERQYGPVMTFGLFLVMAGAKARSTNTLCVGGILVLLVILTL